MCCVALMRACRNDFWRRHLAGLFDVLDRNIRLTASGFYRYNNGAGRNFVANLDVDRDNGASLAGRNVHRGFVGFQREQRVFN